jgi:hypothetical protein
MKGRIWRRLVRPTGIEKVAIGKTMLAGVLVAGVLVWLMLPTSGSLCTRAKPTAVELYAKSYSQSTGENIDVLNVALTEIATEYEQGNITGCSGNFSPALNFPLLGLRGGLDPNGRRLAYKVTRLDDGRLLVQLFINGPLHDLKELSDSDSPGAC